MTLFCLYLVAALLLGYLLVLTASTNAFVQLSFAVEQARSEEESCSVRSELISLFAKGRKADLGGAGGKDGACSASRIMAVALGRTNTAAAVTQILRVSHSTKSLGPANTRYFTVGAD